MSSEAEAASPPPAIQPLDWCNMLITDFPPLSDGGNPGPGPWSQDIGLDPSNPDSFVPAMATNCQFGGLQNILTSGDGPNSETAWLNQITGFELGLFNCQGAGIGAYEAGSLTIRDLLPPGQADQTLTQADVNALIGTFVNAVNSEVSFMTFSGLGAGSVLTTDQVLALEQTMLVIAENTPNVTPSLTTYTYDACSNDAGSDGD